MAFYPVFLTRLDQKRVILLGGNEEAERKTEELLSFGAVVHVISSQVTKRMQTRVNQGDITWTARDYRYGDLTDAFFIIAADYSPQIAEAVSKEANEKNLLINVMDNIPLSNSAFGSVVSQGKLTVSFSTNGLAPALAVRLKERFQNELDDAYGNFLEMADAIRDPVMKTFKDPDHRKDLWYKWVDSETISLLREGKTEEALDLTEKIWGQKIMFLSGLRKTKDS